jgi:hypothetical protein
MKKLILTGTLSLLFLAGAAQYCGGGFYKLSMFVENGETKKEFTYEFFPAPSKLVEQYKPVDRQGQEVALQGWEEEALNTADTTGLSIMLAMLEQHKMQRRGAITPELRFITYELTHYVLLLRISDGKYSHYILGNFLGGCSYELKIIWQGKEGIAVAGSRRLRQR